MTVRTKWDPKQVDIGQDLEFQRRDWRVQRIGWGVMLLIAVAAFLGLLGGEGPFAEATAASADGRLTVDYDRVSRHGDQSQVQVRLDRALFEEGKATLWIERDWLDGVDLRGILPEPERMLERDGAVGFVVTADAAATGPTVVTLSLQYDDVWLHGAAFEVGGSSAHIDQLIYP